MNAHVEPLINASTSLNLLSNQPELTDTRYDLKKNDWHLSCKEVCDIVRGA